VEGDLHWTLHVDSLFVSAGNPWHARCWFLQRHNNPEEPMGPVWIVVADSHSARIYAQRGRGAPLSLVDELEHAPAALKAGDLVTDTPGRQVEANRPAGFGSAPTLPAAQGGTVPHTNPEEVELDRFARMLARRLDEGRVQNAFTELVVLMPARPLGRLRGALHEKTRERIVLQRSEDILHLSETELTARLANEWFLPTQPTS
jgi:protein required for attachment to host cells